MNRINFAARNDGAYLLQSEQEGAERVEGRMGWIDAVRSCQRLMKTKIRIRAHTQICLQPTLVGASLQGMRRPSTGDQGVDARSELLITYGLTTERFDAAVGHTIGAEEDAELRRAALELTVRRSHSCSERGKGLMCDLVSDGAVILHIQHDSNGARVLEVWAQGGKRGDVGEFIPPLSVPADEA